MCRLHAYILGNVIFGQPPTLPLLLFSLPSSYPSYAESILNVIKQYSVILIVLYYFI